MSSPAAWHPDPLGRHQHRYWDGTSWTEHVADAGELGRDPLAQAPPAAAAAATVAGEAQATAPATPVEPASAQAPGEAQAPRAPEPQRAPQAPGSQPAAQEPAPQAPQAPGSQQAAQAPGSQAAPAPGQPEPRAFAQPGPAAQQPAAQAPAGATNGLAVTALVLGLLSLVVSWIPFIGLLGVFGGFLALVFGLFGRSRAKKMATGAGMAMTGIITGVLSILLGIASTAVPVMFFQGSVADIEEVDRCMRQGGTEAECIDEYAPAWLRFLDDVDSAS